MSTLQSDHPLGAHPGPGRAETRERLSKAAYDLLVIGGGTLGTSVAWHSAQSGLRVAMVDAGDFADATSSASSKLAHGGLRYLQTGAVKLVAENHHERRVPAKDVAPTWSTRSPSTCRSTRAARTARPSSVRASSRTRCCLPSATASGDSYPPPGPRPTTPACAPTASMLSRSTATTR
ncbi:FAD-dependent oxidoreductase [Streptomyces libani]